MWVTKQNIEEEASAVILEDRIISDKDNIPHLIPGNQYKSDMTQEQIKSFPMINEPLAAFSNTGVFVHPFGVPPTVDYGVLWTYFKYTPEIVACVRAIVEDIMSDGWHIDTIDKGKSGRNKKLKAERFLMENYAKEQVIAMLYDCLVTGDGYFYTQKFSKKEVRGRIEDVMERPQIKSLIPSDEIKADMIQKIWNSVNEDEDIFSPRSFIQVPSSTLKAQFDREGNVWQWIQKVGVRFQTYSPDEIIHFRLLRLDGKFYGFSPMASILKEMDILANVKDFARYFFEKGGVPNFMFILKNETPKSENYKIFKKTLQLYSSLANKYKSMVVTGDVAVEPLNKLSRDMEFKELAKYLSQILIMAWGVPVTRLSDVGFTDKAIARGSTVAIEGYYRKIRHLQDLIEDMLNMELLKPFGVELHFNRQHIQDLIREVQVDKIKTDTAEQRITLGLWSREDAADYLGIDPNELPTDEEIRKAQELLPPKQGWGSGFQGQSQLNKMQTLSESSEKIGQAADKQAIALQQQKSISDMKTNIIENVIKTAVRKPKSYIVKDLGNKSMKIEEAKE